MTTLQLFLCAAGRCGDALGCADQAQLVRRLVYNDPLLAEGIERFKVWPTNANRSAFETAMAADSDPGQSEDDPDNEIQEAAAYFRERIEEWATEDAEPGRRLEALRVTATDLLKLVAIRLEDSDNPQVIFETLNARGTPLIALDLLKNSVFLTASEESADADWLYEDSWAPELDRDYWREDRRQGRLFTKNGDLFLMHWLVVELARPVPATELFKTFQAGVLARAEAPAMAELIPRLCADAAIVRSFDEMPEGSPERRFFDLLEILDTTTMIPVALLLFREPAVEEGCRRRVLAMLEDFLVRRMICGVTTKNYNRLVAELVAVLKGRLADVDMAAEEFLAGQEAPVNRWPSDAEVREVIVEKQLYGFRRQDRLVMVLWEIEARLRTQDPRTEQGLARPENLTLEHVLPQSWEANWPLDESVEDPRQWREQHLHRLGNLTLTTGELNSSLSHGPWHAPEVANDKRRGLARRSLLLLNTRLSDQHPEAFTERDIDQRGEFLADEFCRIWPGPRG